MEVKEVNKEMRTVMFEDYPEVAMMRDGRVVSSVGYITPAQRKKMIKMYYAIFK